ncbi:cupredoxin domain-containing protein [Mesorhizobium sp. B1-1-6]|uniref:cupredoxin domain-containing protein n=1 Tax=Mesorhizobium sp. B1-1-6 TaxID=2589978 RepID=UPI00112AE25B|nr:cupredoxin domain-containing protein [Mesorhizobium sp. B1-1-6]TPN35212.1 cupredoxin domain-containing protein [Mesorhizobium sp. B1-1-6]
MTLFPHPTLVAIAVCLLANAHPAAADENPTFVIELSDGAIAPRSIEVPANARFKLELRNTGSSPVEFESVELRKEKVLGPGVTSFVVILRLNPGEYRFFDDFHPGMPPAMLIAKEPAIQ